MRVIVHMISVGSSLNAVKHTLEIYCGSGEQLVRWLGVTACARMAYDTKGLLGTHVPQSVLTRDGVPMDGDVVLNEMLENGDEVFVEFGPGPQQFRVPWDGRPKTPPFKWSDGQLVLPRYDEWLTGMDLGAEGLDYLIVGGEEDHGAGKTQQLAEVKSVLQDFAGMIQGLFVYYTVAGEAGGSDSVSLHVDYLNPCNFRMFCRDAKVITEAFHSQRADAVFQRVVSSSPRAREAKGRAPVTEADLRDFMLVLVVMAGEKFMEDDPHATEPLPLRLRRLVLDHLMPHVVPKVNKDIDHFRPAWVPKVQAWVARARELLAQTLASVQLKRVRSSDGVARVEVRYLLTHLQRWGIVPAMVPANDVVLCFLFAAAGADGSSGSDPDVTQMTLMPTPVAVDEPMFERFIVAIAYRMFEKQKPADEFDQFFATVLNQIFEAAGVTQSEAPHADE